jgi:hypothetical protein
LRSLHPQLRQATNLITPTSTDTLHIEYLASVIPVFYIHFLDCISVSQSVSQSAAMERALWTWN